jgi:hypothetical protein
MHRSALLRKFNPAQIRQAAFTLAISGGLLLTAIVGTYGGSVAANNCAGAPQLPPYAIHYEGEPSNQYPRAAVSTLDYGFLEMNLFLPGDVDLDSYQALIDATGCPIGDGVAAPPGHGDQSSKSTGDIPQPRGSRA